VHVHDTKPDVHTYTATSQQIQSTPLHWMQTDAVRHTQWWSSVIMWHNGHQHWLWTTLNTSQLHHRSQTPSSHTSTT